MKNFKNILLDQNSTIKQALQIIDKGDMKIALIVNQNTQLIGTIADGDIRRALLRGMSIDDPVTSIINTNCIYAKSSDSKEKILQIAKYNQIYQIPIVDEQLHVLGIDEVNDFIITNEYRNKVVLMVGGLGTRLRPLTNDTPKSLLRVGNKPILEIIVENFAKYGFKDFIFSVNYKSEMIEEYFGNGQRFGISIEYVHENKRMGTAGALSLMKDKLKDNFFVMNGDLLTNINFEHLLSFHSNDNALATMCVREYDLQIPYGVVKLHENRIVSIEEKPLHRFFVNAGIYLINPKALKYIPNDSFFDMPTLFDSLIKNEEKTISFPIREYWLDIGEIEALKKANIEYSENFE